MVTMLDLKQKLVRINSELEQEDLTSIKFLCHDDIPQNALNQIKDGLEFFWELERLGKINLSRGEINFLLECLYRCHRIDLIKKMGFDQHIVQNRVNSGNSFFSAFRLLLFEIAEDMDDEDLKRSIFLSAPDIPGSKRCKIKSIQDLFIQLQKSDIISPENVKALYSFQSILTWKIQAYAEKLSTGTYLSVNTDQPPAEPSPVHRAGTSSEVNDVLMEEKSPEDSGLTSGNESVSNNNLQEGGLNPLNNQGIKQHNGQEDVMVGQVNTVAIEDSDFYKMDARPRGLNPLNNQGIKQHNGQEDVMVGQVNTVAIEDSDFYKMDARPRGLNPLNNQGIKQHNGQEDVMVGQVNTVAIEDSDFYKMDARPRGEAIIINNKHFKKIGMDRSRKKLSDRIGSDKDADILVNTWKNLGFKVSRYDDLTSAHMIEILEDAAKKDHSKYDCLVVCILSHGVLGHVYGSDGLSVEINHLKGFFSGSRSLVGKPKLFFVQACQGKKNQKGHAIETNAGVSMKKISQERQDLDVDGPTEVIPDEADFLLAHATAPGYVSYRKESGSSYIRILTNNLDQFADKLDLLTILTKVNKEVGQIEFKGGNKQISAPMYTLRKKVLFY